MPDTDEYVTKIDPPDLSGYEVLKCGKQRFLLWPDIKKQGYPNPETGRAHVARIIAMLVCRRQHVNRVMMDWWGVQVYA